MESKEEFKRQWREQKAAGKGFSVDVGQTMAAHFEWLEEAQAEDREEEEAERFRPRPGRRRLDTTGRVQPTKGEEGVEPDGDEDLGDEDTTSADLRAKVDRLCVTAVAHTKALQRFDSLHSNTIVLQKKSRAGQMKDFYAVTDALWKELNGVMNDIASVSPQGPTIVIQVKLQQARKRILDKINNWISSKGHSDVVAAFMGDGPLKQLIGEMPRAAFAALREVMGQDCAKDLYTWWPPSSHKAEWAITYLSGECLISARSEENELVTTVAYRKTIKYGNKTFDGKEVGDKFKEKTSAKHPLFQLEVFGSPDPKPFGKQPKSVRSK